MIILALDASTTAVGWALFDNGDYLESGVYVPKGKDWERRVSAFSHWLFDNGFDFDAIGFEMATGDHGNMHTDKLLGAVEFVVRQFCRLQDVPLHTVTASQVKATGCHKDAIPVAVAIAEKPMDYMHAGDEADAIGVGLACWKKIKEASYQ